MKRSIDRTLRFASQSLNGHFSSESRDQLQIAVLGRSAWAALRYSGATCSRSKE